MAARLPHYCVVGGGISGLATAYFISLLKPAGSYRLTLLEASPRCGGWIHSVRNPNTGAVYELGPHSARATSPTSSLLLRMALSLDLRDSLLWLRSADDSSRNYLYVDGQLVPISPLGFSATKPFTRSPLGMITRRIFSRPPPFKADCSVDEFLRTRLDDEFADYLGSAMMRGIFAGDSRELSARACLPQLVKSEELGPNMILGLLRGARKQLLNKSVTLPAAIDTQLPQSSSVMPPRTFAWSLSAGMQTLTNALYYRLRDLGPHTTVHVNSPAQRVYQDPDDGSLRVDWCPDRTNQASVNDIDALFLCCPSYQAADLLQDLLSPALVARLTKKHLPWANVAAAVLELTTPTVPPARGFGHLVPRMEDDHVLGVIYDSVAFPQLDSPHGATVRYTVMMKPLPEWLRATDSTGQQSINQAVEAKAIQVLRDHLKLPTVEVIDRKIGIYRDCIPQYPLGHLDNVKTLRKEMEASNARRVHLVGYSYDGVGIGDAVHSALKAVSTELGTPL